MNPLVKNLSHIDKVPEKLLKKWLGWFGLKFWLMLFVEVPVTLVIVPIASFFPRYELRTDTMKRLARERGEPEYKQYSKMREYLPLWANWFQTHDNAADEYFWGGYKDFINDRFAKYYAESSVLRYYNRVMWHWRNKAYGFSYTVMGEPRGFDEPEVFEVGVEDSGELWVRIEVYTHWFKYEAQIPTGNGKYRSVNIGWKSHRSAPPLKNGTFNVLYGNRLAWFSRKEY